MATQPLGKWYRKAYQDFSGGLNTKQSPLTIKANQFASLTNCNVNRSGVLQKSSGWDTDGRLTIDNTGEFVRMLVNYRRGTSVDVLVAACLDTVNTNTIYQVDLFKTNGDGNYDYIGHTTGTADFTDTSATVVGHGTLWLSHLKAGDKITRDSEDANYIEIQSVDTDTSLTLVTAWSAGDASSSTYTARKVLNKNNIPVGAVFNNKLVISNGADIPLVYNNTTLDQITDADVPKVKLLEPHKRRLFGAGTSGDPSNLYWSLANNESGWDPDSLEPIFAEDNGSICAIRSFSDSMIVFKDNGKIYQVAGDFDQSTEGSPTFIRKLDTPDNIGRIAGFTPVIGNDNILYFLSETGVYGIDVRLGIRKVSWNIDPLIDNIVLRSTTTASKSFTYDSKTQWDTGVHTGTVARSDGNLYSFCDTLTLTNARQHNQACASIIDANNDVHIAYANQTSGVISYTKWLASDKSQIFQETIVTETDPINSVAIALNSSGDPGIVYRTYNPTSTTAVWKYAHRPTYTTGTANFTQGSAVVSGSGTSWSTNVKAGGHIKPNSSSVWFEIQSVDSNTQITLTTSYSEPSAPSAAYHVGSWLTAETVFTAASAALDTANMGSLKYRSDGEPRAVIINQSFGSNYNGLAYHTRLAGTWTEHTYNYDIPYQAASLLRISDTEWYIAAIYNNSVNLLHSTNDASFSGLENIPITNTNPADNNVAIQANTSGNIIYAYTDNGLVKVRNYSTTTTTTPFATTNQRLIGFNIDDNDENNLYITDDYSGGKEEKFLFEDTNLLANTSDLNNLSDTYIPSEGALTRNGNVFCSIAFGASTNTVTIRRFAYRSNWLGPVESDSTLSLWDTFVASSTGSGITFKLALDSTNPPTVFNTATSGSVISTNPALIYAELKVEFILQDFSGSYVSSSVLNYIGEGVGPQAPTAVVFNNEIFFSYCESGLNNNQSVLLHDIAGAWSIREYAVTFMCRYRGKLYGGSSVDGHIYTLEDGSYSADDNNYSMEAITKEDFLGSLELKKEVKTVYVLYKHRNSGHFTFSYRTDNFNHVGNKDWTDVVVPMSGTIGDGGATVEGLAEVQITCGPFRTIQFKISDSQDEKQVEIIGFTILYGYLNLR